MQLYCRTIKDKPGWRRLQKPFTVHRVTVPSLFEWNGASCPRYLWFIVPPFHKTIKASCIHDYLCRKAENREDRKGADKIFEQILKDEGIPLHRRKLGYWGVRLGSLFGVGNNF